MKREKTINQYLDLFYDKYGTNKPIKNKDVNDLYDRLFKLKISVGGRMTILPRGDLATLIEKLL